MSAANSCLSLDSCNIDSFSARMTTLLAWSTVEDLGTNKVDGGEFGFEKENKDVKVV